MLRLVAFLSVIAVAYCAAVYGAVRVDDLDLLSGPAPGPETFDCTGKNGYFADHYRQCRVFYRCLPDGTKYTYTCILDLAFNETANYQTCMDPTAVNCPYPETS